jgi:multidrug efflux pump subunit AcrA (membrane-fusion protein)
VELADDTRRLTVPLAALGSISGQDQVWVIADGALLRRAVTLGRRDDARGRVEVLSGLTDDAQVLGVRFDNLREGTKAVVAADKPSKPGLASSGNPAPVR